MAVESYDRQMIVLKGAEAVPGKIFAGATDVKRIDDRVKKLEEKLKNAEDKISGLKEENEALRTKINADVSSARNDFSNAIDGVKKQITDVGKYAGIIDGKISHIRYTADQAMSLVTGLKTTVNNNTSAITDVKNSLFGTQKSVSDLNIRVDGISGLVSDTWRHVDSLRGRMTTVETRANDWIANKPSIIGARDWLNGNVIPRWKYISAIHDVVTGVWTADAHTVRTNMVNAYFGHIRDKLFVDTYFHAALTANDNFRNNLKRYFPDISMLSALGGRVDNIRNNLVTHFNGLTTTMDGEFRLIKDRMDNIRNNFEGFRSDFRNWAWDMETGGADGVRPHIITWALNLKKYVIDPHLPGVVDAFGRVATSSGNISAKARIAKLAI